MLHLHGYGVRDHGQLGVLKLMALALGSGVDRVVQKGVGGCAEKGTRMSG